MFLNLKQTASLVIAVMALSCGSAQATSVLPGTVTIFAASSLTETFTSIGRIFEETHPGTKVAFSFLSSSTLATQLLAGAPADVFAAAAPEDMNTVKSLIPKPVAFVTNRVVLAVPLANRLRIVRIKDLNKPKVKWIQCAHQVPCGMAADKALVAEGTVTSKPESLEPKVTSAVTKILAGEVDAAIVFRTDVVAHSKTLRGVAFSNVNAATTMYLVGAVSTSAHISLAKAFVDLVLSVKGMRILSKAGFGRVKQK